MSDKQLYKVMWTSGYDSTFRICQLAKEDIDIQPFYVYNKKRKSADIEIERLEEMRNILLNKKTTKATILPIEVHNLEEFMPIDQEYMDAYKEILKSQKVGDQYRWMAQVSNAFPGLELTIERAEDMEHAHHLLDCLPLKAELVKHGEGALGYYTLAKEGNDKNWYTLLHRFHFPAELAHMTKRDCYKVFLDMGDEDIMKKTWFCQLPYHGDACGYCGPCRTVVNEGMEFRLSEGAKRRYKYRFFYLACHKIKKGIKLLFGKDV